MKKVNFFDHADIYGTGECEELFGKAFKMTGIKREDVFIQSKCGIIPGVMFALSKEHIIASVDGILKRLGMEYLDALLLHRPVIFSYQNRIGIRSLWQPEIFYRN